MTMHNGIKRKITLIVRWKMVQRRTGGFTAIGGLTAKIALALNLMNHQCQLTSTVMRLSKMPWGFVTVAS